jgi:hypothetical protein
MTDEQVMMKINEFLIPPNKAGAPANSDDLVGAQFHMAELDRRAARRLEKERQAAEAKRDRIETKRRRIDLGLELLIVVLIGFELFVGVREGEKQFKAMDSLEKSSTATANTLTELKKTMEAMNGGIQTEVGLNYNVALEVTFDNQQNQVNLVNRGRTNLNIWGVRINKEKAMIDPIGKMLAPGGQYYLLGTSVQAEAGPNIPTGTHKLFPFDTFIKNENGVEFVVESTIFAEWKDNILFLRTQATTVRQVNWSKGRTTSSKVPSPHP